MWSLGGLIKSAATFFVAKDNYEDVVEATKSFIQFKYPELKSPNICAIGGENTLVLKFMKIDECNNQGRILLSVLCKSRRWNK